MFTRAFLVSILALAGAVGDTASACESPAAAEAKLKQAGQYPIMRGHFSALEIHRVFLSASKDLQQGMLLEEKQGQICRYAELRNIRLNLSEQVQFPNWSLDQSGNSEWNTLILMEGMPSGSRVVAGGEIAIFTSDVTPSDQGEFVILRGPGFAPYKSRSLLLIRTTDRKPRMAMVLLDLVDDENLAKLAGPLGTSSSPNSPAVTAQIERLRSRITFVWARQDLSGAVFSNEELKMMAWRANPDSSMTMNGRTMLTRQFYEAGLEARTKWLSGKEAAGLSGPERAKADAQFSEYVRALKRP